MSTPTTEEYRALAYAAITELLAQAHCTAGDLVVIGCSSSEVSGHKIGSAPAPEVAAALLAGLLPPLKEAGLYLAAQCCEHLNRALILEKAALLHHGLAQVNVRPQPHAGGSFATAAWQAFSQPVAAEHISAAAGLDIGATLIGMHLRPVAVPVRLSISAIGHASLTAARTRPKFIGGPRAAYDETLL